MRDLLVAGNWKMNGSITVSEELISCIVEGVPQGGGFRLLVCPPFPYLAMVGNQLQGSNVALGAQNVSSRDSGAYTGETAPSMLKDVGCEFVIVGHSERRALFGETSDDVAAKFMATQAGGMTPILCLGETLDERASGATEEIIDRQFDAVVEMVGVSAFENAVIAYEPVWAIGTGMTATPVQAQDVHKHIRARLADLDSGLAEKVQILYGGSMKGDNAPGLLGMADIDGGLIGGASLKANDFLAIAAAAVQS
jgi:triosephosphate isomerase